MASENGGQCSVATAKLTSFPAGPSAVNGANAVRVSCSSTMATFFAQFSNVSSVCHRFGKSACLRRSLQTSISGGKHAMTLGSVRPMRRLRRARPVSVRRQNNGRRTEGSQRQVRLLIDRMTLCVRVIQRFRQYRGGRPAPTKPQSICDLAMGIQCCGGPLVLITRRQMMGNWC